MFATTCCTFPFAEQAKSFPMPVDQLPVDQRIGFRYAERIAPFEES